MDALTWLYTREDTDYTDAAYSELLVQNLATVDTLTYDAPNAPAMGEFIIIPQHPPSSPLNDTLRERFMTIYDCLLNRDHIAAYWHTLLVPENAEAWFTVFSYGLQDGIPELLVAEEPPTVEELTSIPWSEPGEAGIYAKIALSSAVHHSLLYVGSATGWYDGAKGMNGRKKDPYTELRSRSSRFNVFLVRRYRRFGLS